MIIKTYKANTNISINVVLPSKKNLHVSFVPLSDGSSTFTTDNEYVQKAVESHYNFGKLFKLASVRNTGKAAAPKKPQDDAPTPVPANTTTVEDKQNEDETPTTVEVEDENTPTPTEEAVETETENEAENEDTTEAEEDNAEGEEKNVRKVKVTDIAAAKDYLADTFGISRTSMRSTKAILEKAAEHGIEFEGL